MVEVTPHPVWYYLAVFFIGFLVFNFLASELYQMVDPYTIQCPLAAFDVSLPIKEPAQSQFQLLQNRTQSLPGEIPYVVS